MFKRHRPETGTGDYSRLEQHDEEDEAYYSEQTFHHPNSVLVANHHGHCNVVPLLSQNMPVTSTTPHHSPPHSPRASFSAATHVTRRFFQTKLPIVFRKDMASTASFSSLPPVIIADLQNGNIPEIAQQDESGSKNDQGWTIIHKRRFRGKHGIGESRHPNSSSNSVMEVMIDEEIDPSDQVTCSVFVKWQPETESEEQQPQPYTMTMSPLFVNKEEEQAEQQQDVRYFQDPIPETEERFKEIVQSVRTAIENNMQPTRISQGSSGSYFCRNSSGKIVGVFKPKNEEPYGRLNPKWTKWIHRHLFPCFFGRSCLIPNLGYLSEAAASLIDRKLGTMVVPYTDVIHMSSPSFHYDYLDRRSQHGLPPKIGSFQCFLTDYKDATVFFRDYPYHDYEYAESRAMSRSSVWGGCLGRNDDLDEDNTVLYNMHHHHQVQQEEEDSDHTQVATTPMPSTPTTTTTSNTYPHDTTTHNKSSKKPHKKSTPQEFRWTHQLQKQFRREFEQLVILDYLIRNTDRGLDNWMIKYCPPKAPKSNHHHHHNSPSSSSSSSSSSCSSRCSNDDSHTNKQASSKQQQPAQPQESKGHIHVAAIDNGLAFPYKHPDQWRSYPYGWIAMPDALVNRPFSEATRKQFLPILSDPLWWRDTVREMRALFELDDDFDEKMFQKQMAVLKGQGYNIIRTLKDPAAGPIDLVAMQRVVINQEEVLIEYDDRILQSRGLHLQTPASNPPTSSSVMDISDALPAKKKSQRLSGSRRLRTQRSTSFDVISSTSSPFYDDEEEEEEEDVDLEAGGYFPPLSTTSTAARRERKWKDKLKDGLSMDLGGAGLFGKKKKKKSRSNRYRAFDSDGDISDHNDTDSFDSQEEEQQQKPKRVTVVMETIDIVKSRTYFTCC